jgi:hypothetical protein
MEAVAVAISMARTEDRGADLPEAEQARRVLAGFRGELYRCLTRRGDELFEVGDALFCHVYGRGKGSAQMIPDWPYSVIAALEPGRTSWTAVLDAVRLRPGDDETEVTAGQVRDVVARLIEAGHWRRATRRS